jgi:hypothetical protein
MPFDSLKTIKGNQKCVVVSDLRPAGKKHGQQKDAQYC